VLFEFEAAGEKIISRKILRLSERASDARPAFNRIANLWMDYERELFDTEGASGRGKWKPIKASTVAAKQASNLDLRILHATLALRESLTERGGDQKLMIEPTFMVFGSHLPYADVHQHPKRPGFPQRRVIDFTEGQKRATIKVLQRFLVKGEVV
jgi:phage gpG-like protein